MNSNYPPDFTEKEKCLYAEYLVRSMPNSLPISLEKYKELQAIYDRVQKYEKQISDGAKRLKYIEQVNHAKNVSNKNYLRNFNNNNKRKF